MFGEHTSEGLLVESPTTSMDVPTMSVQPIQIPEFVVDFGAGLLGGCAGLAFGHPFDTIKVRQQTQIGSKLSIVKCLKNTMVNEGPRGLFKGMAFPLAAVGFQNSVFFGVYGNSIRWLSQEADGSGPTAPSYGSIFVAGAFAGAVQSVFASPIELVKVKLQTSTDASKASYRGPMHCMSSIYNQHGLRGVFHGLPATFLREIPGLSVYITSYQFLCDRLGPAGAETCTVPQMLIAGGLAGICSWIVNIPIDIVKSRIQADDIANPRYKNTRDCFVKSYQNDGWRVFWRGLPVTCLRAFPTNAVTFAVYSSSLQYMHYTMANRTPPSEGGGLGDPYY